MTIYKMKLSAVPFEKIVSGEKVIESRLYDEKRQQVNPGDQIEFTSNDDSSRKVVTTVKALYRYPDFESMFSDFPPSYFGGASKEELLRGIGAFYSKEEQIKYGVIGIKIGLVK
ncbi:MAG: ASCH domain-containing protein [Patescibacteria group bacterium]|nr:ASCH domain-containing protein [Patescibacteria group bacterium]